MFFLLYNAMKSRSRKYLLSVAATFFNGENKIEGRLKISKELLVFAATSTPERLFKKEIPIKEIGDICKKNSLGVIPNIIILKTKDGDYKFAVYAREHVVRIIEQLKEANS